MSRPVASTVSSGIMVKRLLVTPRKFPANAIPVADNPETNIRLGDVPIALMMSAVDILGGSWRLSSCVGAGASSDESLSSIGGSFCSGEDC